ncbi:MAG: nuclease [Geobacteraceae bacterium]|nr:nuclease [Geobacteraceae bacterium]NTW80607.1 nuclease [Geobacteraceae bacterium]
MILAPLIKQIVGTLWYLLPLLILAALIKSSWFKGVMGEFIVNVAAKLMLDKNEYHLIKNVTMPTEDGTTQIDHVIVSKYGIFVVETKNIKGWIFGDANQSTWTQQIFKHKSKFQNPLRQNYKHVKTLESLLGLSDQQIHSLIVFVGESTFKTEMPANVTHGIGYIRFIKSKTKPVLTVEDVREIVSKIEIGRLTPSFKTNREHIKHVKTIISEKQNITKDMSATPKHKTDNSIIDVNACKACGSEMKIREKKSGDDAGKKYWVCIKFPECRNVEPYSEANWF